MELPKYEPFDYFETPLSELKDCDDKLIEYGIDNADVSLYLNKIEKDRKTWHSKRDSMQKWAMLSQVLVTIIVLFLISMIEDYVLNLFGINGHHNILGFIFWLAIIGCLLLIWKDNCFEDLFHYYITDTFKQKTQDNCMIEKYLEDCHWEWYNKVDKPRYRRIHNN